MPHTDHHAAVRTPSPCRCAILVTTDTRNPKTDESGKLAAEILTAAGHRARAPVLVPNDKDSIQSAIEEAMPNTDLILLTGGTGPSSRDVTLEAVRPLLEKELDGFGELFRRLSYDAIGTAAWISRATAGVRKGVILVATPGSPDAVRLALEKVLLPELGHLRGMAAK